MKVLLLTDRMDAGGAETHVAQLARGLRRVGVEVTLLSSGGRLAEKLIEEGIPHVTLPLSTHNPLRLWAARRQIRRTVKREGFEILHAHARLPAFLLRGCERWKLPDGRPPVAVVTAHARLEDGLLSRLSYWGEKTVAVSEDIRLCLCQKHRLPAERIRVIPNGVDCEAFSPPRERKSTPSLRVLFASRLDADCSLGAKLLCRVAPKLYREFPALRITLAGGGSELESIYGIADTINRTLGVELIRTVGHCEDMPSLLREQDIFVGVSRCAMEAGASGCAVILCGNEGYGGILSEQTAKAAILSNLCGRGDPLPDEERLERDLRLLLSDASLCRRLGEECRTLVKAHFSAEGMCRAVLMLYHGIFPTVTRKTMVIGGYFGCGNLGDDAILQGLLTELRRAAPWVRPIVLTGNPRRDERRFGVECIHRKNPFAITCALAVGDVFLFGGGSLLQNLTSRRSLDYYLWLTGQAKRMGCLTVLYAAGVGPLIGASAQKRVQRRLSTCDYISLRDPDSKRLLSGLGVDRARLFDGADPALFLPHPGQGRSLALLRENGVPPARELLCAVLRESAEPLLLTRLFPAALRVLAARHGLLPILLSFDTSDSSRMLQKSASACGGIVLRLRESADAVALFSAARLVLSMRLHGLILAALSGTPAVGVCTEPRDSKIPSFARSVGQEFLSLDALTVGNLVECMETSMAKSRANRPILADSVAQMRKKARKDLANILFMLYNR